MLINVSNYADPASTQLPSQICYVLLYSPFLFGKNFFSLQNKLVNNNQTHFLKQHFSAMITPID